MPQHVGMDSERHLGGRPKPRHMRRKATADIGAPRAVLPSSVMNSRRRRAAALTIR